MAEVVLTGLSKAFGKTRAVADLSLTIADGEFVVLLGPTGAGKTTTLRLIAGIERPDEGTISIAGRRVETLAPAERDVTFVFQQYSLYPHLTARENLAFPLKAPGRSLPGRRGRGPRRRDRPARPHRPQARQQGDPPLRRRDAARGDRPGAGARADDLPDGRAALLARRQAPRRAAARAQAHPARPRRHHPLRHPRPDRGDDHGRPHRHPRGGPPGADRHPARDLRDAPPTCTSPPASASRRST